MKMNDDPAMDAIDATERVLKRARITEEFLDWMRTEAEKWETQKYAQGDPYYDGYENGTKNAAYVILAKMNELGLRREAPKL